MIGSVAGENVDRSDAIRGSAATPEVELEGQPDLVVSESDPGVSRTDSPEHSAGLSRLGLVPAIVVLAVVATTSLLKILGPVPERVTESDLLSPVAMAQAIKEPRDQLTLMTWWLLAIIGGLVTAWFVRRPAKSSGDFWRIVHSTLNVIAVGVIVAALTWGPFTGEGTPLSYWVGVSTLGLLVSFAGALLIFRMWTWPAWASFSSTVMVVGLALVLAVSALWQTPQGIRDPHHFTYTSDELAAIAAGHLPLSDYVPQYSVLLGFPVAPLLRAFPSDSVFILLVWIFFLQVLALGIAVAFPVLLAGKRMLAPAMLLGVMPPLATGPNERLRGASTYYACFPMRVVLPAACLLVAFLVMRNRSNLDARSNIWKWAVLGFMTGAMALNNLDFGLPAALAVLVTILLAGRTWRECVRPALITLICAMGAVALYVGAAAVAGRSVSLGNALLFARSFGVEGFGNEPMGLFDLYIAAVSLFISATIFGYVLLRQSRNSGQSFLYQQGLVLALVGGWSLLSLPYFAGRSFPSTLIGGHTFQIGLVVAAFLPLIWKALGALLRGSPDKSPWETALGMAMGTLAITAGLTFMLGVRVPSEYVRWNRSGDAQGDALGIAAQEKELQALFADPANSTASRLVAEGRVQQALVKSSLTSLSTGMKSALVVSHPEYLTFSHVFVNLQCRQSWPQGVDHILVSKETAEALQAAPECQNYVDFEKALDVTHGATSLVLLPAAKAE